MKGHVMLRLIILTGIIALSACSGSEESNPAPPSVRIDRKKIMADPVLAARASDPERFAPGEWHKVSAMGKDFMVAKGFRNMTRVAFKMKDQDIVAAGMPGCNGKGPVVVKMTSGDKNKSQRLNPGGDLGRVAKMGLVASCGGKKGAVVKGTAATVFKSL